MVKYASLLKLDLSRGQKTFTIRLSIWITFSDDADEMTVYTKPKIRPQIHSLK